jgi:hypothetical protein
MPRECTDTSFYRFVCDVHSIRHDVSNTMANKNNKKTKAKNSNSGSKVKALEARVNQLTLKSGKQRQKKSSNGTPFANLGAMAGGALGGMFGQAGLGAGVGKWLGSGIGSIVGSGDYQQMGSSPKYNVITNGSQIPQFSSLRQTNVVCHREYLGDIQGTAGFNNTAYPLNPGMSQTFPWLSTVAENFQEYRIHGLVFEFRSLITDFVTSGVILLQRMMVFGLRIGATEYVKGSRFHVRN